MRFAKSHRKVNRIPASSPRGCRVKPSNLFALRSIGARGGLRQSTSQLANFNIRKFARPLQTEQRIDSFGVA